MRRLLPWLFLVGCLALVVGAVYHAYRLDERYREDCRAAGGVPVVEFTRVCYRAVTVIDIKVRR